MIERSARCDWLSQQSERAEQGRVRQSRVDRGLRYLTCYWWYEYDICKWWQHAPLRSLGLKPCTEACSLADFHSLADDSDRRTMPA